MSSLALFDFDGTITWTDTWTPFMRMATRPWRLAAGRVLLSPVVAGYRLGLLSASTGRCIAARVAFTGEDAAAIRGLGADYAARGLPCICATLEERAGAFTGRYVGGDCSGPEKVRRVKQRFDLAAYDVIYAYGDSVEDRELLELADEKWYRWVAISRWSEVTSHGHPPVH